MTTDYIKAGIISIVILLIGVVIKRAIIIVRNRYLEPRIGYSYSHYSDEDGATINRLLIQNQDAIPYNGVFELKGDIKNTTWHETSSKPALNFIHGPIRSNQKKPLIELNPDYFIIKKQHMRPLATWLITFRTRGKDFKTLKFKYKYNAENEYIDKQEKSTLKFLEQNKEIDFEDQLRGEFGGFEFLYPNKVSLLPYIVSFLVYLLFLILCHVIKFGLTYTDWPILTDIGIQCMLVIMTILIFLFVYLVSKFSKIISLPIIQGYSEEPNPDISTNATFLPGQHNYKFPL